MTAGDDQDSGPPPLSLRDGRFAGDRALRPWSFRLGVYLRTLAAIELVKGLVHWALLIGAGGASVPLEGRSAGWFVANGVFAVADPVAAVGLWVGAAWGVAIWLIAAVAQIVASSIGGPTLAGWFVVGFALLAMSVYLALSIKARAEIV